MTYSNAKPATVNVNTKHGSRKAACDSDGTVRVWDDVAGYYSAVHSLTESQVQYVRSRVAHGAELG